MRVCIYMLQIEEWKPKQFFFNNITYQGQVVTEYIYIYMLYLQLRDGKLPKIQIVTQYEGSQSYQIKKSL